MTNQEILQKAIKKAVRNGYNNSQNFPGLDSGSIIDFIYRIRLEKVIFSHEFAKAFWGNELICKDCGDKSFFQHESYVDYSTKPPTSIENKDSPRTCHYCYSLLNEKAISKWQFHLQQMVLEEEPIKYLEKFL